MVVLNGDGKKKRVTWISRGFHVMRSAIDICAACPFAELEAGPVLTPEECAEPVAVAEVDGTRRSG